MSLMAILTEGHLPGNAGAMATTHHPTVRTLQGMHLACCKPHYDGMFVFNHKKGPCKWYPACQDRSSSNSIVLVTGRGGGTGEGGGGRARVEVATG